MKEDERTALMNAYFGPDRDEPVLARCLIMQARLWSIVHPAIAQEVRDHIALRVMQELGAGI